MKFVITGAGGLLGQAVIESASAGYQVTALTHGECDITDVSQSYRSISGADVVINCAGAISSKSPSDMDMIQTNALGPHVLASACHAAGAKLIHVSTDCVFRGDRDDSYTHADVPDAVDLYGRTKAIAENIAIMGNCLVVRTSFVGPGSGLWQWVASQDRGAIVFGYRNAMWSGGHVNSVADALVRFAANGWEEGIRHLSTEEPISKDRAIRMIAQYIGRDDITIYPVADPRINRAMAPTSVIPSLQSFLNL